MSYLPTFSLRAAGFARRPPSAGESSQETVGERTGRNSITASQHAAHTLQDIWITHHASIDACVRAVDCPLAPLKPEEADGEAQAHVKRMFNSFADAETLQGA